MPDRQAEVALLTTREDIPAVEVRIEVRGILVAGTYVSAIRSGGFVVNDRN
jgi:hypothetical protein